MSRLSTAVAVLAAGCLAATGCEDDATPGLTPLPRSICAPLAKGKDRADVIIVSDLPLRGAFSPSTRAMADAARAAVVADGFRAGRHAVAFQSCDNSSAEEGNFTAGRCAANMRAYSENRAVVGVVGPFQSDCARAQIGLANAAPGGPLGMLSPSNTRTGLTRPAAGAAADEPGRYYPRGIRNYARLVAPEDAQVRVDVRLARRLGARRVFVLDDGDDYGIRLGRDFRALASGLGVRVVGDAAWGKSPESQVRAAKRAEAAGAEAVFVSGIWQRRGVEMVGALRRVLGPEVPLIAPDGFVSLPRDTLPAMRGLWVSAAGLPPERFPAGGRAVARRFGPGQPNSLGPAYAAQAVEVLMGAIARSDGSRQSVSRELLKTNTRITVLGPVRFDSNGDLIGAPISIHRVTPRELRLERVVVP